MGEHIDKYLSLPKLGISATSYPPIVGKFKGRRCVIVASAACVWDDLSRLGIRGGAENNGWDVMCINDSVMHYPGRVRHLYSNDDKMFEGWLKARRREINRDYGYVEMVHSCITGGKYTWPWPGHGTSLLGGVYTALALGYGSVVICGGPLDSSPHYFDPPWRETNFHREVFTKPNGDMKYWQPALEAFRGRVKSMSGRTRDLLGEP